jgi:hypothetical protein
MISNYRTETNNKTTGRLTILDTYHHFYTKSGYEYLIGNKTGSNNVFMRKINLETKEEDRFHLEEEWPRIEYYRNIGMTLSNAFMKLLKEFNEMAHKENNINQPGFKHLREFLHELMD